MVINNVYYSVTPVNIYKSFVNVQVYHKEDQPLELAKLLTVYIMETARLICDYPMETVCLVFSLENFTMANMVYKQTINILKHSTYVLGL